jgi:spore photoproduct lyase
MSHSIRKVFIEDGARDYASTERILTKLRGIPVLQSAGRSDALSSHTEVSEKDLLHLVGYKGEFLKPCPGTKGYICCGYLIFNVANNCPLDCSYCILQSYFSESHLSVFVNVEEGLAQVLQAIDREPERVFRVGTGEFTDSLAMDPVVSWSKILVPAFTKRRNAVLELKTKTTNIEGVLSLKHRDRIIMSWSLNSPLITSREEHKAPGLEQRLKAAGRCQSEGFVVGFHFDPLIPHPGWKEAYLRTLDLMDKFLDTKRIIWISLGSFRFIPALKQIIRRRHPQTCVLDGEFIVGLDGKMRYFKPIRIELYGFMRELLKKWCPDPGLYLCMESDDVWKQSMCWSPSDSAGLSRYLDQRVLNFFE